MLGPAKTVREYAAEMKALAVEDCAAMHKATDFDFGVADKDFVDLSLVYLRYFNAD